jgi:hypothetical protein
MPTNRSTRCTLAYRVENPRWEDDAAFAQLLDLLTAHRPAVDEVSFFDEAFPIQACTPMAKIQARAELLCERQRVIREAGIPSAGINVLVTLGHGDVPSAPLPLPVPPMVGHDGHVSNASACPNSDAFRAYTRERYAAMARSGPDFIWVDDDYRWSHHGALYPCFCPTCLELFGQERDREALVARLNDPAEADLRVQWSAFLADTLTDLAREIGEAVHGVDPGIELGLMTIGYSHSSYGNYAIGDWAEAMEAVRLRPGHGYYTDERPREIVNKAMDVARQIDEMPASVHTIQYEMESYPWVPLNKAPRTVCSEITLSMAAGCTGAALNTFHRIGTLDDHAPLLEAVTRMRPVWQGLVDAVDGLPLVGMWAAHTPELMARRAVGEQGWFHEGPPWDIQAPNEAAQMGLPLTSSREDACGALLAGRIAEALDDATLRELLAGGVILDAEALDVLWARGLGELTGARLAGTMAPTMERLTRHALNGEDGGDGRRAGDWDRGWRLEPLLGADVLSRLETFDGVDGGPCLTAYENRWGGRVVAMGYAPWNGLGRGAKRRQLLRLADWVSRGKLPVTIATTSRVMPLVRRAPDGRRIAVVLMNLMLDDTPALQVMLRTTCQAVSLLTPAGPQPLDVTPMDGSLLVRVPPMRAWDAAVLVGA